MAMAIDPNPSSRNAMDSMRKFLSEIYVQKEGVHKKIEIFHDFCH